MIRTDLSPLANHLWQSTLCVVAAWALTLILKKNRPAVRYWLWLAASLKFLVPFSLLLGIGSQLGWRPAPAIAPPQLSIAMNEISLPFAAPAPAPQTLPPAPKPVPNIPFALWIAGFAVGVTLWVRGWLQIRRARGAAIPLAIDFPIPVLASPTSLEPGVFGIRKPVLLLPQGITERIAAAELQAILAHELCHVRRRDNLTASVHLVVETVFWFFPLVWWMRARLVEEREKACDEEVLRQGIDPRVYAQGILDVCKFYLGAPSYCVSAVTGSNLTKRIQAILTGRVARDLTLAKKVTLATAGIASLILPVLVGVAGAPRIRAQSPPAITPAAAVTPKFEEISIRPCNAFRGNTVQSWSPGTLHSECTTLERLLQQAFGLFANGHMNPLSSPTVTGGPAWVASSLYEIQAKAATLENRPTMNGPMLQALLEDRFKLRLHRETREIPVYTLTRAKGAPPLPPFQGTCTPRDFDRPAPEPQECSTSRFTGAGLDIHGATIADLRMFFLVTLDRPVIDETGMAGRFNFHLEFPTEDLTHRACPLPALSDPAAPPADPALVSAIKAAVEKLGLHLEPATGPGEFLVIDHVELPSGS